MPYCEVEDVKARAGRLKDAWDETTPVKDSDIERFVRDASATIDVGLGAHGFTTPATDSHVQAALVPVVADMALLTALEATWPGGSGPAAVSDLISDVRTRVGDYMSALADGKIGFLLFLKNLEDGGGSGASSFWESEMGYSSWLDDLQQQTVYVDPALGAFVIRSSTGPTFHKDMKL